MCAVIDMPYKSLQYFSYLFILITLMSVNQWSRFPIGNYSVWVLASFVMIGIVFWIGKKNKFFANPELRLCNAYLLWLVICIIRGAFVAENYWEYKQLVSGSLSLSMPLFVFYFKEPFCLSMALQKWNVLMLPLFLCFFAWTFSVSGYSFLITPFLLYGVFFIFLSPKWKIFVGLIFALMFVDLGARAQIMKVSATILCAIAFYYNRIVKISCLKIVYWLFYFGPVVLLILGITGIFNVFKDSISESNFDKYTQTKVVDGKVYEEHLAVDTRTFIYEEVLASALKHNYVIWGRTPARGNDSYSFGIHSAEDLKTGKYERHSNEVGHLNVFTWLGLIGLLLHSAIYLMASYRAVYHSNNLFVKYIGVLVAFNWALGWIENMTGFNILNMTIWIMISICLSSKFRSMNDMEFKSWFDSLFVKGRII